MVQKLVSSVQKELMKLAELQKELLEAKQTEDKETAELKSRIEDLRSYLDRTLIEQGYDLN